MDALRVARVDNVTLESLVPPPTDDTGSGTPTKRRLKGTLHLTPHHLIFHPEALSPGTPASEDEIWIPYPTINLLTRLAQTFGGVYPLQIRTRTFESYVLGFDKAMEGGAEDVWQSVKDCALAEQLYAFFYTIPTTTAPYSARAEYVRQGVGSRTKAWRFTDINRDYAFCPTYPAKMVVPSRISDSVLVYAGKYRSKGRIPALTYLHSNQASITRSSQPMVGLKNARSPQDEHLIECIFSSHLYDASAYGSTSTNLIIDARPTTNAMANVAMGAGTENMENYKMAKKAYLGIDNIHVMRSSLKTIMQALNEADAAPIDRSLLRKSNWLRHISTILDGALIIVKNVHVNASHVLIHCSDGWDRTAQLAAVAQICLDPFYRTFNGFKTLVEKDWVSFGHKFLDRSGHLSSEKFFTVDQPDDESDEEGGAQRAAQAFFASVQGRFKSDGQKEVSPVFHQFLDCVRQIQRQFPTRFEWNEDYLLDVYYHLYSCQFGTFLFNNERSRVGDTRTVPVWAWLEQDQQRSKHRNHQYDPLDDVILYDPRDVKFWHRLFRRGDDEMNGGRVPPPGAEVATVLPGQSDPPANVHGAASPPAAAALAGPSGKGTFRAIDSTSSAFSLQTATNSPVIDAPSPRRANGALDTAGSGGGWGWSHFSSALQRGAKEIRTIGEGAYNQIRAEIDDGRARTDDGGGGWNAHGGGSASGAWREMQGPSGPSTRTAVPRLPSEANPWAATPSTGRAATQDDDGWGTDPWGAPAGGSGAGSARPTETRAQAASTLVTRISETSDTAVDSDSWRSPVRQSTLTSTPGGAGSASASGSGSMHRSLADLTLGHSDLPSSTPSRSASIAPRSRDGAPGQAGVGGGASQQDKDLQDALGGDRRAWDPLGAL